jgi:hypothetical protein
MSRIYQDDCICPDCYNCNTENDLCKIGRGRYPTDGCFDFTERDSPEEGTNLEKFLGAVKKSNAFPTTELKPDNPPAFK